LEQDVSGGRIEVGSKATGTTTQKISSVTQFFIRNLKKN